MWGCKTCIQAVTYQDSLNHWRKWRLRYIKNNENSITRESFKELNVENIFSKYSYVVLPDVEPIHPCAKDDAFSSMCDFPENNINLRKLSCVLKCFSECPGVFVPDAEIND